MKAVQEGKTPRFFAPGDSDYQRLAEQWVAVENLVREEYGLEVDQSISTLQLLQLIIDDNIIDSENTLWLPVSWGGPRADLRSNHRRP